LWYSAWDVRECITEADGTVGAMMAGYANFPGSAKVLMMEFNFKQDKSDIYAKQRRKSEICVPSNRMRDLFLKIIDF
jgi:hypothetical protein